jgi:hypothetical protein
MSVGGCAASIVSTDFCTTHPRGLTAGSVVVVNKPLTALAERLFKIGILKLGEEHGELLVASRLAELSVGEGRVPFELRVTEGASNSFSDSGDGDLGVGWGCGWLAWAQG